MNRKKQTETVINAVGRHGSAVGGPQLGILGQVLVKHLIDAQPGKSPIKVLQELHKRLTDAHRGALEHFRSSGQ
jgi:hypothetical protein